VKLAVYLYLVQMLRIRGAIPLLLDTSALHGAYLSTGDNFLLPYHTAVSVKLIIVIVLMMEVVSTSETSVYFYETTRSNIPNRNSENLKSHSPFFVVFVWDFLSFYRFLRSLVAAHSLPL
jgi:hypothetical protein